MEDLRCPICLENVKQPRLSPCCSKVFCEPCLRTAFTTARSNHNISLSDDDNLSDDENRSVASGSNDADEAAVDQRNGYGASPSYSPRPLYGASPPYYASPHGTSPIYSPRPLYGASPPYYASPHYGASPPYSPQPMFGAIADANNGAVADANHGAIANPNDDALSDVSDGSNNNADDDDDEIYGECPHCRDYGSLGAFIKNPIAERVQADIEKIQTESEKIRTESEKIRNENKLLEERLRKNEEEMATMIKPIADECPLHPLRRKTLYCTDCSVTRCQECSHPGHGVDFIEPVHANAMRSLSDSEAKYNRLQDMTTLQRDHQLRLQKVAHCGTAFLLQKTREMANSMNQRLLEANAETDTFFDQLQLFLVQKRPDVDELRLVRDSNMLNRLVDAEEVRKRLDDEMTRMLALAEVTSGVGQSTAWDSRFNLKKILWPYFNDWDVVATAVVQIVPGESPDNSYQIRSVDDDTGPLIVSIEEEVRDARGGEVDAGVVVVDEVKLPKFDEETRRILHPLGEEEKFDTRIWRLFVRDTGASWTKSSSSRLRAWEIDLEHFEEAPRNEGLAMTMTTTTATSTTTTTMPTTSSSVALTSTTSPLSTTPMTETPMSTTTLTTAPMTTPYTTPPLTAMPSTTSSTTASFNPLPSTSSQSPAAAFSSLLQSKSAPPKTQFIFRGANTCQRIYIPWTEPEKWFRDGKLHALLKMRQLREGRQEEEGEEEVEDENEGGSSRPHPSASAEGEEEAESRMPAAASQEPSTSSSSHSGPEQPRIAT